MFRLSKIAIAMTYLTPALATAASDSDFSHVLVNPEIQLSDSATKITNPASYLKMISQDEQKDGKKVSSRDIVWSKNKNYLLLVRRYEGKPGEFMISEGGKIVDDNGKADDNRAFVRTTQFKAGKLDSQTSCDVNHSDQSNIKGKYRQFDLFNCITVNQELCDKLGTVPDLLGESKKCARIEGELRKVFGAGLLKTLREKENDNIGNHMRGFATNFHSGPGAKAKGKVDQAMDSMVKGTDGSFRALIKASTLCDHLKRNKMAIDTVALPVQGVTPSGDNSTVAE